MQFIWPYTRKAIIKVQTIAHFLQNFSWKIDSQTLNTLKPDQQ